MNQTELNLFYGALLANLGPYLNEGRKDQSPYQQTAAWLTTQYGDNPVSQLLLREPDQLALIAYAGQLVSGDSRRESSEKEPALLEDIFNHFNHQAGQRYLACRPMRADEILNCPSSQKDQLAQESDQIFQTIRKASEQLTLSEGDIPAWLTLLEQQLTYMPEQPASDISLYEHSRLTAALSLALFRYQEASDQKLDAQTPSIHELPAFLLASFDLSGIQDFIYNIVSDGALKQLKARSLYLDLMSEYLSDSLLKKLGLSRANLLYVGGGHAYFILPNTATTMAELEDFEEDFNAFLLKNFQTKLYVAFGWSAFSGRALLVKLRETKDYRKIYQTTSRMISDKKLRRYDAKTLRSLNQGETASERECSICHTLTHLEAGQDGLCRVCYRLEEFSKQVKCPYFVVTADATGLPIGPGAYLSARLDQAELEAVASDFRYAKNDYSQQALKAQRLFIGDHAHSDIHHYADLARDPESQEGIKRMAVLRLDVDNLGAAFMAGFSHQEEGRYNTLARSAVFSKNMSRFFKEHLNQLAKGKKLTIVYAGGDDVFAIGSWQDIIAFAVDLRQDFIAWSDRKLTLSAGIGLFADKTPVHLMARESGDLESAAKDNGKDSIALFSERYTLVFDDFIEGVYRGKLPQIRQFFDSQDERGKGFIYKLIDLLRSYEPMNVARLAYLLARLEEMTSKENKEAFTIFKKDFYDWYRSSDRERLEAELALLLYVYEIRKD